MYNAAGLNKTLTTGGYVLRKFAYAIYSKKGTSRQRSGKGAIRKKIPTPKTEAGINQTKNKVLRT